MSRTYLDYNATAPLRAEAREALLAALDIGNPSSVHEEGRKARALVEAARADVAALVSAPAETVIFTSGGTEACNLALGLRQAPAGEIKRLLVSAIEHSAVLAAAEESVLPVELLPVTADGVVDMAALDAALQDETPALVCVMLANNETGTIQPIAEIAAKTRAHGSLLFCDAVQAAGKMPIDIFALGADALSLSGHKLGAPMGIGALVTHPAVVVPPQLLGGGQELADAPVRKISRALPHSPLPPKRRCATLMISQIWPTCAMIWKRRCWRCSRKLRFSANMPTGLPIPVALRWAG